MVRMMMLMLATFMFLEPSSPEMVNLTIFHDHVLISITMLSIFTMLMIGVSFYQGFMLKYFFESQTIEIAWTILPIIFLIVMGFYSLMVLFENEDDLSGFDLTYKAEAHQWYWTYSHPHTSTDEFDSYMEHSLSPSSGFRSLGCDHNLVMPIDFRIRVISTSADVIHSWALPSAGVKADAIPGRLNSILFSFKSVGLFYGQCSELCGVNHSFMPISVEALPPLHYWNWSSSM